MSKHRHILEVWGDLACFTWPSMKVERYSYPVITPSAARAIFDAIYWKPDYGFYWQIERVEILRPPKYIALRRNEVKNKAPSTATILQWARGKKLPEPIWADGTPESLGTDQEGRTQRQTMALKDVHYRLYAHMQFRNGNREAAALDAQFRRHASHGKCVYQPYFGCREFPAWFRLVDSDALDPPADVGINIDIGWMVYDVFDLAKQNDAFAKPAISVFEARVKNGVMLIPRYDSPDVRKLESVPHA